MSNDLKKLWFEYLIEFPIKNSEKEKQIINEYTEKENQFRSKLNEEQIVFLKNTTTLYQK